MRKILLILFVLISFISSAQKLQYDNTYGREYQRVQVDTLLGLPKDTFLVPATLQNIPFIANKAGSIYLWNIVTHVWDLFSSGGGDFWSLTGNAVAQDTSKFIGTTDSSEVALRFRINNYNAGYLGFSYQTSNPPYTNDGNNHTGMVALGYRAGDSLRKLMDGGTAIGTNSVAIGADALRDNSVAQNTAIGNNAMKRARTMVRNTVVGQGALQYAYTGDQNVGVGTFVMEVQDGVTGGTAVGMESQRSNKMGVANTSVGSQTLRFGSTLIESITITNGGSGYTSATVTISAPETATPGTISTQATATATVNAGAVTAITMVNKGNGYSSTKTPIIVTISGDGTGATATAVLKSSSYNTIVGYFANAWNYSGQGNTVVGSEAAYGTTTNHRGFYDDDITLVGFRATRGTSRGQSTPFKYSTAIGSNATFECDSCFILGTTFTRTGTGTTNPDPSAQLDVTSTTRGFLPPRMSAAQRVAIASPASGLIVFDLDSLSTFQYNGSAWQNLYNTGGGGSGDVVGPASATDGVPALFDGTTGKLIKNSTPTGTGNPVMQTTPTFTTNITTPLIIGGTSTTQTLTYKTTTGIGATGADHIFQVGNNGATEAMRILNSGFVGINRTAPIDRLDVSGGIRGSGSGTLTALANSFSLDNPAGFVRMNTFGPNSSTRGAFQIRQTSSTGTTVLTSFDLDANGNLGLGGVSSITAKLHLAAGTATASTAPLKFTSGTNLTTPEAGAVEFDGTNYFATSSTTRYTLAKTLTATATLDFDLTAVNYQDLTITVTGAADGNAIVVGVPNGAVVADVTYFGWVSGANTVTIRCSRVGGGGAANPASGTFRASVVKY